MVRSIAVWSLLLSLVAAPAFATWNETSRSPQQTSLLNRTEQLVVGAKQPVVVFDLDSTLYKNTGRWGAILQEFGKAKNIPALQAMTADRITDSFNKMSVLAKDAKLGEAAAKSLLPAFEPFWTERFFNNDYVQYDTALPGAVAFVNALYNKGATIVYITGRGDSDMRKGTVAKLKADGFPINQERSALFMKPQSNLQSTGNKDLAKTDKDWKSNAIEKVKTMGTVVASFENEPGYINLYYNAFHKEGKGLALFLDTDMFPSEKPIATLGGVKTINGFLR